MLDLCQAHLQGAPRALFLTVSEAALPEDAQKALRSSAAAFDYAEGQVGFLTLEAQGARLDAPMLLQLVEAVDPLCLVAADSTSASLISHAYHAEVATDAANRVLGRTCVAFRNFAGLMETPESKQRAWALLKKLPRYATPPTG